MHFAILHFELVLRKHPQIVIILTRPHNFRIYQYTTKFLVSKVRWFWFLKFVCVWGWTWYVANDMQFYLVSPVLILTTRYSRRAGFTLISLLLSLATLLILLISAIEKLPPAGNVSYFVNTKGKLFTEVFFRVLFAWPIQKRQTSGTLIQFGAGKSIHTHTAGSRHTGSECCSEWSFMIWNRFSFGFRNFRCLKEVLW